MFDVTNKDCIFRLRLMMLLPKLKQFNPMGWIAIGPPLHRFSFLTINQVSHFNRSGA